MSTRFYPLYQLGNPQLRIFLPNFWLKLVEPEHKQPKNVVQFHCSMEMTKHDVKNYLEKIYDVHPIKVNTRIALGKTHLRHRFVTKDDDIKIAYVILPKNESFTFPNIISEPEESQAGYTAKVKQNYTNFTEHNKAPGVPSWFTV